MIETNLPIYLCSRSPRRRKLLNQINLKFRSFSIDVDESILKNEKPVHIVKRLASNKLSEALKKVKKGIIITADTIVVLDNKVLGKPEDEQDAVRILKKLSGRVHTVYTGFSIFNTEKNLQITDYEKTKVEFRKMDEDEIREYVRGGSPMDKAGAYGIQDDFGAVFIKKISGCYYNVVGLPLQKVYQTLKKII
jgi:septum formation protein